MIKRCSNCKRYNYQYGHRNGKFVGGYIGCDYGFKVAKECRKNNYNKWESIK